MSKEIEDRLDRLEKALGSFGTDIHEFDSPAQAKAYAKQLEDEQTAEEKQQAKAVKEAEAAAEGTPPAAPRRRKPASRKPKPRPTTLAQPALPPTLGSGR